MPASTATLSQKDEQGMNKLPGGGIRDENARSGRDWNQRIESFDDSVMFSEHVQDGTEMDLPDVTEAQDGE